MTYEIGWMDGHEGRIIHERLIGEITYDDLKAMIAEANRMMDGGQKPIHLMVDSTAVTKHMMSLSELRNSVPRSEHENLGWTVMVSNSLLMGTMTQVVTRLMRLEFRTFQSIDAAMNFLREQDATLVK